MSEARSRPAWAARALMAVIAAYQRTISPLLTPRCRFLPSCSEYTQQALERHGVRRGLMLGAKRIGRCHPFHEGGFDPVPEPVTTSQIGSST